MTGIVVEALLVGGAAVLLVAALGVHRMPDLYTRMHASTKAASLAALLVLSGVALHFRTLGTLTRSLAIVAFLFLTLPVSAHLVGRAVYRAGEPPEAGDEPGEPGS